MQLIFFIENWCSSWKLNCLHKPNKWNRNKSEDIFYFLSAINVIIHYLILRFIHNNKACIFEMAMRMIYDLSRFLRWPSALLGTITEQKETQRFITRQRSRSPGFFPAKASRRIISLSPLQGEWDSLNIFLT